MTGRRTHSRGQSGVVLVFTAIAIVVLLAVGALALDLGRLFVLRTEMQNAVDSASLAGALELDGRAGARARAIDKAKNLLSHKGHFAENPELLKDLTNNAFAFYSWIGSSVDGERPEGCGEEAAKCAAEGDSDARYIKIVLDPSTTAGGDHYTISLFFLPLLQIMGIETDVLASTSAQAVAGRHFFICEYPPLMICDPFESAAAGPENFIDAVDSGAVTPGDTFILKYQANSWAPGNFSFLLPCDADGNCNKGAKAVGEAIADPSRQECTSPRVHTRTGTIQSWPIDGWNTRFDVEGNKMSAEAAPNVMDYWHWASSEYDPDNMDETETSKSWAGDWSPQRFFEGDWDQEQYWDDYHAYHGGGPQPGCLGSGCTRWEMYQWEISSGYLPCDPGGADGDVATTADNIDCTGLPGGEPDPNEQSPDAPKPKDWDDPAHRVAEGAPTGSASSDPERRQMFFAVVSCDDQDVHGSKWVRADAFVKFMALSRARRGGGSDVEYVAEYIDLASEEDSEYHVEVQLYE